MPSSEAAGALYSDDYFRSDAALGRGYEDYEAERDNMRAMFRDRLRHLPAPAASARLLDVGAAAGFFVEQARLAGWDAEGLELNGWAAEYAREKLGVPVEARAFGPYAAIQTGRSQPSPTQGKRRALPLYSTSLPATRSLITRVAAAVTSSVVGVRPM